MERRPRKTTYARQDVLQPETPHGYNNRLSSANYEKQYFEARVTTINPASCHLPRLSRRDLLQRFLKHRRWLTAANQVPVIDDHGGH